MADVKVIVHIYAEDEFIVPDIFLLTINGTPINVTMDYDFGWTTAELTYGEGVALSIVVTNDPDYYIDASINEIASNTTFVIQLELVNPTVSSTWEVDVRDNIASMWNVGVRPATMGRPISFVDEVPLVLIPIHILHKLDEVNVDDILRIDEVFIPDGTWHIDISRNDIGIDWNVTITA